MARILFAFSILWALVGVAVSQSTLECSGSNLHLSLATAGSQTIINTAGTTYGSGIVMYGMSNPATCATQGVAYIVNASDNTSNYWYGWALICVSVPGCTAGTVKAKTTVVRGSAFAPTAGQAEHLAWTASTTIDAGIYGLALGTNCSASCPSLFGDVGQGSWYPFVQAGTGTTGSYPWGTFSSSGFGSSLTPVPPTTGAPVLGTAAGPTPPSAVLY